MSLILTLRLDPASQCYFEELRQLHFPPARNLIPAHLTLFHNLPETEGVLATLEEIAHGQEQFELEAIGLLNLGRGVAFSLSSQSLQTLHERLCRIFRDHLIPQDRQRFRPHIVIQNKVTPAHARALLAEMQADYSSRTVQALGLDVWRYLNGPWEPVRTYLFRVG